MSDPKRMLAWMALLVAAVAAVCVLLFGPLSQAFLANPVFNGVILAALLVGAGICFAQVLALGPAGHWVDQVSRGFRIEDPPRLLAPLAAVVAGREREGFVLSPLAMRSLLDGVRIRLDESRDISRYLVGLLIFLGLLGTFWGLLDTVGGVGRVIGGLTAQGEAARAFADLSGDLQVPLAGMATAFSSSLFGLAGALALGVLDLQAGHAQNRFFAQLEEFLAGRAQLPVQGLGGDGEGALPPYLQALLEQTAENLAQIQRMMARGEEDRRAGQAALAQLTDRLGELSDQLRTEQKVILSLTRNQLDLQPAMAELAGHVADAVASNQEMRAHLRSVDAALARLVEEVSGARGEVPEAMRQEIKLLAQSLGGPRGRM
ncbi:MAG TPA: hypothetical protein VM489_17880 [Burkholderiales bacterium]|nr:hypothetical protein [Burkholderiales bacterium]